MIAFKVLGDPRMSSHRLMLYSWKHELLSVRWIGSHDATSLPSQAVSKRWICSLDFIGKRQDLQHVLPQHHQSHSVQSINASTKLLSSRLHIQIYQGLNYDDKNYKGMPGI